MRFLALAGALALACFSSDVSARNDPADLADAAVSVFQTGARASAVPSPRRHVAGPLTCAVNVNAALAERGLRGTGSAMAKSFLAWGRACSCATPWSVRVYHRGRNRAAGHVAITADASGNIHNPGKRGWQYGPDTRRPIACRCGG